MARWSRSGSRWGWSAWAVVALAVALRLTVLPGYMVATQAHAIALVMCTGEGAVSQTIKLDAGRSAPGKDSGQHPGKTSVCPFATAGVSLAAHDTLIRISPPRTSHFLQLPAGAGLVGQGLAAPPPPSTGPPFSI